MGYVLRFSGRFISLCGGAMNHAFLVVVLFVVSCAGWGFSNPNLPISTYPEHRLKGRVHPNRKFESTYVQTFEPLWDGVLLQMDQTGTTNFNNQRAVVVSRGPRAHALLVEGTFVHVDATCWGAPKIDVNNANPYLVPGSGTQMGNVALCKSSNIIGIVEQGVPEYGYVNL
eukprot:NODE_623_length_775_cov_1079.166667_g558_i0.p1 GENE.NODE_623_length_775_cov_1079.166667_g558_i0~~NODE_623_length_775_cov_1079.166667_g558_i0.p1  ORF type:complete len:179 (-),score=29.62 NODE_623_length_775_cov_1079.166667_g558_i0:238-750(-)